MTQPDHSRSGDTDSRWVDDPAGLGELAALLERSPVHALDTESNSGFAYRERLCLLQINVGGRLWMVDLLALEGDELSLESLRQPLQSDQVRTVLHGGEFDVGCFKRDYDIALGGVWDTQQAASFLGWSRTGYGSVVEEICGVSLDKAYAHYDWGRRPIAAEPLSYAVNDVRYLPRIAERLEVEIAGSGLADELAIANRAVEDATWTRPGDPASIWKLKGVRKLPLEAMPQLMALWQWRESMASLEDRPPGRLLNTGLMLAIARRSVRRRRDLRSLGLRGRTLRYADEILSALRRAVAEPPEVPPLPRTERSSAGQSRRLKRLRDWRRSEAERRGVPHQVVLPPTAMHFLARHGGSELDSVPQLGEKRIREYGRRLAELCS